MDREFRGLNDSLSSQIIQKEVEEICRVNFDFSSNWGLCVPFLDHLSSLRILTCKLLYDWKEGYENLPPCMFIGDPGKFLENLDSLTLKVSAFQKNPEIEDVRKFGFNSKTNNSWVTLGEECAFDTLVLLKRAGMQVSLSSPCDLKEAGEFFASHRDNVFLWVVSHRCQVWNPVFSVELAKLVLPGEWRDLLVFGNTHYTVTNGYTVFDILLWYDGINDQIKYTDNHN